MERHYLTSDPVVATILGRSRSMLADDLERASEELAGRIEGKRLLIVGAAGSVGHAFVHQVLPFKPAVLHLIDISENNLVEVVRDIHASGVPVPGDFRTFCIGIDAPYFSEFMAHNGPYDYFINFAAMKHVRSERDPYTLMRMIETNVGALYDLVTGESQKAATDRLFGRSFAVSSDKAANPTSAMGATKFVMEQVLNRFSDHIPYASARFANVAFSDGSLLQGWEWRLLKGQPLSGPSDIRRYFFSHEEAGQLCLMSCFLGDNRDIFFPKLDDRTDLLALVDVAAGFLRAKGLEPRFCDSEQDAIDLAGRRPATSKEWPCYFSVTDTGGEKAYEEFSTPDDDVDSQTYGAIGVVKNKHMADGRGVDACVDRVRALARQGHWTTQDLIDALKIAAPTFGHRASGKNLDQKM